jgi:hypothetical protein
MSVKELCQSFLSLSPEDHDSVEFCLVEGMFMRIDKGIVGAHVMEDQAALIFLGYDANDDKAT